MPPPAIPLEGIYCSRRSASASQHQVTMTRLIELVAPLVPVMPTIQRGREIQWTEKIMWTAATLFTFLVACQIPLFGVKSFETADPLYWMRMILASNRGTLMELGISPIVTAGMVLQLLVGAKIIDVNMQNNDDKKLFDAAQKLLGIIMTVGQATAYVLSGVYGPMDQLGVGNAVMIIAQLSMSGVLVLLLDELLQKGWGYGSGISLFIATNVCENIVWKALSPTTFDSGAGSEFEGALLATVHLLVTRDNKLKALGDVFFRPNNLPSIMNLVATGLVFLVVIYLQSFHVTLQLQAGRTTQPYPIKLFYTSNMPIILQAAFVSNLYLISQLLYRRAGGNILVQLLGVWKDEPGRGGRSIPTGGLAYYMSPPTDLSDILADPFRAVFYIAFILAACAVFATLWIEVSGQSSRAVANMLAKRGFGVRGGRSGNERKQLKVMLDRYIPTAAALGGIAVGALAVFADLVGAIGSGTGILLAVTTIYQYYEEVVKDMKQAEMMQGGLQNMMGMMG